MLSRRRNTDQGKEGRGKGPRNEDVTEAGLLEEREKDLRSEGSEGAHHGREEESEADQETEDEVKLYLIPDD